MLLKALCLSVACASYVVVWLPPASSKSISPKKDKIKDEGFLISAGQLHLFSFLLSATTILQTAIYILLMIFAKSFDLSAVYQLQEFKAWHGLATLAALAGCALRKWSFVTLDRFFTYQLTIRSGHKLVQTGPYKYLRHPSYTGAILNSISTFILLWHQGLWDVASICILRIASLAAFYLRLADIPLVSTVVEVLLDPFIATGSPLGVDPRIVMAAQFVLSIGMMVRRINNEEAMLKEHFGAEWDAYARRRWRLVPFVY
ncbi:hypothetical protein BGZ67_001898 [Mortierella alpina]|nr:hypothetical protein BGZ67_001898 [Mortierella alpina]